jgi:pimeloyl-ACP methyl ester carboxylesterase
MKKWLFSGVVVVLLLMVGLEPALRQFRYDLETARLNAPERPQGADSSLVSADCWFSEGWLSRSECAWLFPSQQGEAQTALPVVVLRAGLFGRSDAATVYLSGGPGGSSYLYQEAMDYWRQWMHERLGLDHDLVLYDQRGSGYAVPRLACEAADRAMLEQTLTGSEPVALWRASLSTLAKCAAELSALERAQGLYSTRTAAADLRELIRALREEFGYRSIRLYGVSYGSRLAQVTLSEPVEGLERVVLDGFYPAGRALEASFAEDFAGILAAMDAHCAARADCTPVQGGLRALLARALEAARQRPPLLDVPIEQLPQDMPGAVAGSVGLRLSDDNVLALVEHQLTVGSDYAGVAARLSELIEGRIGDHWTALAAEWLWALADPEFSSLAQALIECHDNPPVDAAAYAASLEAFPEWQSLLAMPEQAHALCERLGVRPAPLPASTIEVPTLLAAAQFDPRTPTVHALSASAAFPRRELLIRTRSGHSLADLDECAATAIGAYLNTGSAPAAGVCKD